MNKIAEHYIKACKQGKLEIVQYLIENNLVRNPHIDGFGDNDDEAFRNACMYEYIKTAKYLFELFEFDKKLLEYEEVSSKIKDKPLKFKQKKQIRFKTIKSARSIRF